MANGARDEGPRNVLIIAMANKLARIAWAVLSSGSTTGLFRVRWQHNRPTSSSPTKVCTGRVKMKEQSQRRV